MRQTSVLLLALAALAGLPIQAKAGIILGTAGDFGVLAGTAVTNTGLSVIHGGNVGVGSAYTGFPPGVVDPPFGIFVADPVTIQAQLDLTIAYNAAAGLNPTETRTGDLGGITLTQGVYRFTSTAALTGILTLDALGDPNAQFVFQIGSTLTTASSSSVVMIHGGASSGNSVFWQVGSSATLGADTAFVGHILAFTSITLGNQASILDGSALARNGAVTLDTNLIVNPIPEPSTMILAFVGSALAAFKYLRKRLFGKLCGLNRPIHFNASFQPGRPQRLKNADRSSYRGWCCDVDRLGFLHRGT